MFIKCIRSQPLIAMTSLYLAVLDGSWYAVVYGRAFKIQDSVRQWKRMQVLAAGREWDRAEAKFVARRVKSIQDCGIVVGAGFSKLKRGTALDFYDFIVNYVCGLLISFPDPFVA